MVEYRFDFKVCSREDFYNKLKEVSKDFEYDISYVRSHGMLVLNGIIFEAYWK